MLSPQELLTRVRSYQPSADLELIKRAYTFAENAHQGQLRKSGDPYLIHPLTVAEIIADLRLDVGCICAGLLHDCVEDTSATVDDISKLFGSDVALLVEGVTKLGKVRWQTREEHQAENFRKMLLAMARDIRVILIKLCDRLDNMRTLGAMAPEKQERIARETMEIYAPLAHRLGIQWIKAELEDLSFRYLYPKEFADLSEKLQTYFANRQQYIDETAQVLRDELSQNEIPAVVTGRPKHLWSIYQKTVKTGRDLDQLFDIIAFRAVVKNTRDCYAALGVVHTKWTPIPGRFKDFVALPKPNMYQSLHTSLIGPKAERIEVQIRTDEMHRVAEDGIAAHWKYKEGKPGGSDPDDKKFAWLKQLMEWQKTLADPTEFIETVKVDLFSDEVFVFTPKGDVKSLPTGATPVDLAYLIHTDVGNHCSGARVNGQLVPLRYKLRNGDTVEIVTSPNQKPTKDWIKFVKTSSAKAKIRHFMRTEQRERAKALGRDLLDRELRQHDMTYAKSERSGDLVHAVSELRQHSLDEMLMNIGYGRLLPADVVEQLLPEGQRTVRSSTEPATRVPSLAKRTPGLKPPGIRVAGEGDVLVRFGKCCSPVAGDPVIGVITRGRGVTVHAKTCSTAMEQPEERRIDIEWDTEHKASRPATVQVVCADKPGILALLSQTFHDQGLNISQANCRTLDDDRAVNTFRVSVVDVEQLQKIIRALQKLPGVFAVQRM
ncbi:MAG: bifunctional (p)ppGpp synthetase/guanosine-3',5'-bis(diphosphate) 3'-pyrophosphohydrolase [Myxococcales bacterium]|nr:bifunctional (p)ppGpp synthetase/guanosine-3',5'-bis(diphosphate) 3'-pyrophosphohydrolase [Myxococcales bacterium]